MKTIEKTLKPFIYEICPKSNENDEDLKKNPFIQKTYKKIIQEYIKLNHLRSKSLGTEHNNFSEAVILRSNGESLYVRSYSEPSSQSLTEHFEQYSNNVL